RGDVGHRVAEGERGDGEGRRVVIERRGAGAEADPPVLAANERVEPAAAAEGLGKEGSDAPLALPCRHAVEDDGEARLGALRVAEEVGEVAALLGVRGGGRERV